MKRRITVQQLLELTSEQQKRLREWWKPEDYDVHIFGHHYDIVQISDASKFIGKNYSLPLLDIGQMIELLTDNGCCSFEFSNRIDFDWNEGSYTPSCLCDALWEEVKRIL